MDNKDKSTSNINQNTINLNNFQNQQALFEHEQNLYNSTNEPTNGTFDKFADIRLRTAIIENYTIQQDNTTEEIDPLNIDKTINMKNGKVVIRWIDYSGGIIRPENFSYPNDGYTEPWTYFPDKDSKYPELRTLDCYNHDKASDREMLSLSHAFIWSNDKNWCGFNYLPPIGSIIIVGFKKNNLPIILGYLPNNYESYKPHIKPGETMIKGYGNNYIHWRWSNKLDLHVNSKKNTIDIDDPYKKDIYPNDLDMWIRFDPFTRNIVIDVNQTDLGDLKRTIIEIKPESLNVNSNNITNNKKSLVTITNDDIYVSSINDTEKSDIFLTPKNINLSTSGDINIKANGIINLSAAEINLN